MGSDHQVARDLRGDLRDSPDPDRVRAQAARPLPGALRPEPRRAVRAAAADGGDRQVRDEGAVPPHDIGRLPVPGRAGDLDHHRGRGAGDHPVGGRPAHLRPAGGPVRDRRIDRSAVRVRARRDLVLRNHARWLGVGLEVLVHRGDARRRPADLLRGLTGPLDRGRDHHRPDAVADRDRPRPGGDVVLHPPVRRLPDLPDGVVRRDQPCAVRPDRGRRRARWRLLHRVRRHPVRGLSVRRIREHDRGLRAWP